VSKRTVYLVLVRHTQTDHNAEHRYSGAREDVPLNETGLEQARGLANTLGLLRLSFEPVWCSDLIRTQQVGRIIAGLVDRRLVLDPRLREVDIGQMGGLIKNEALARFPEPHFRTSSSDFDFTSIGGESRTQVVARLQACFDQILETYGAPDDENAVFVIVISHGTALRIMLEELGINPPVLHEQGGFQTICYSKEVDND